MFTNLQIVNASEYKKIYCFGKNIVRNAVKIFELMKQYKLDIKIFFEQNLQIYYLIYVRKSKYQGRERVNRNTKKQRIAMK